MASNFLKELYSRGTAPSGLSPAEDLRQRLGEYSKSRGWRFHTSSDILPFYRRILNRPDAPIRRLVGTRQREGIWNIIAPTDIIAGKWAGVITKDPRGLPLRSERLQNIASVFQTHEVAEVFERARGVSGKFGSHASPLVIQTEMEVASRLGSQTLSDVLTIRKWEQKELLARGFTSPHWKKYSSEMGGVLETYTKNLARQKRAEYIGKALRATEEGVRYPIPQAYFIGPEDVGAVIGKGDENWFKFLSQQTVKTAEQAPRRSVSRFTGRKVGGFLLGGMAAVWALNKVFSGEPKKYGLQKEQEDILATGERGAEYSNLEQKLKREFKYGYGKEEAKRRFDLLALGLEKYGEEVGTGHKRLLIPYEGFSKEDVESIGFTPVKIAIPEAGQTEFTTYRHPSNLYHFHQHKHYWTLHEDEYAAATMLSKRRQMEREKEGREFGIGDITGAIADFTVGLPHVLTEGVPGLYYYAKGQIEGAAPMEQRVLTDVSPAYRRVLSSITHRSHSFSTGLAPNRFSGFDDAYNTIEGMNEQGWAARGRKQNTDFGSGYRGGMKLLGTGAALLTTIGVAGKLRGASKTPEPVVQEEEKGLGWISKALIGASALSVLGPTLSYGVSRLRGGLSHQQAWAFTKASFSLANERFLAGIRAVKGVYSKEATERLQKEQVKEGIYSSKIGRALAPVFEIGRGAEHTAAWLKKNWVPELKRGEMGAVGLGALTLYEGYEIGEAAYEGDWEAVGKGVVSFAGAKYAYMGWHKFLNSPEKRLNALRWAKKQTLMDALSYVSSGLSVGRDVAKAGVQVAAMYPQFIRTGAHPKALAIEYGQQLIQQYSKSGMSIADAYKDAWGNLPEELRNQLASKEVREKFVEMGGKIRGGVQKAFNLDEEGIRKAINIRQSEIDKVSSQSWLIGKSLEKIRDLDPSKIANMRDVIKEQINMGINMAIPKENAGFNSFDGLAHGGMAEQGRHKTTPFGSKYDRARALASMIGQTFEAFIGSKGFKQALSEAKFIKTLGKGRFGEASLFETTLQGERFQFVKKTIREGAREELYKEAAHPEKYLRSLDLLNEAKVMRPLGATPSVPSVYGASERELFMEHMPGEEVYSYFKKGNTDIKEVAVKQIQSTLKSAAQEEIVNLDIHAGNILYDPETERMSWIDWGQAYFGEDENFLTEAQSKLSSTLMPPKRPTGSTPITNLGILSRKRKKKTPAEIQAEIARIKAQQLSNRDNDGMRHGGLAARKRSAITEFGSRWKGLFGGLSKKITKYLGTGAREGAEKLLDPRRAAKMSEGKTLEEFAKAIGEDVIIIRTPQQQAWFQQLEQIAPGVAGGAAHIAELPGGAKTIVNPERLRASFAEMGRRAKMSEEAIQEALGSEDFAKTVLYHEALERQTLARYGGLTRMPAHHYGAQVLVGEGGYVAQSTNSALQELFRKTRGARKEEIAAFEAGFDAFSKDDVAAELRPLLTDFASPYRGLLNSTSIKLSRAAAGPARASMKLTKSAQDLKIAQEHLWKAATNAGQGHRGFAGGHIKQLSRFGGN